MNEAREAIQAALDYLNRRPDFYGPPLRARAVALCERWLEIDDLLEASMAFTALSHMAAPFRPTVRSRFCPPLSPFDRWALPVVAREDRR